LWHKLLQRTKRCVEAVHTESLSAGPPSTYSHDASSAHTATAASSCCTSADTIECNSM
jgi:hypothetical protein